MKITITSSTKEFDITAAWRIIGQMLRDPRSVIGLSTGQTTMEMHRIVSAIHHEYPFDVSQVTSSMWTSLPICRGNMRAAAIR